MKNAGLAARENLLAKGHELATIYVAQKNAQAYAKCIGLGSNVAGNGLLRSLLDMPEQTSQPNHRNHLRNVVLSGAA